MAKNILLWVLAVGLTLSAAVYQRLTGPTYPIAGETALGPDTISYMLERSHGGDDNQRVAIAVPDQRFSGTLVYRRYNTGDHFSRLPMAVVGDSLVGELPHQPPAGKLEYYVVLNHGETSTTIPADYTVITRFKGDVPNYVLAPHVFFMFFAMLWSTRALLEALRPHGRTRMLTVVTTLLLLIGGMILGPVVQKFAFGAFWTGVPFGWDLTDNKTLVAFVAWALALWRHRKTPFPRWWVLAAAVILLAIFTIPHSTMGSELDYTTGEVQTG